MDPRSAWIRTRVLNQGGGASLKGALVLTVIQLRAFPPLSLASEAEVLLFLGALPTPRMKTGLRLH